MCSWNTDIVSRVILTLLVVVIRAKFYCRAIYNPSEMIIDSVLINYIVYMLYSVISLAVELTPRLLTNVIM